MAGADWPKFFDPTGREITEAEFEDACNMPPLPSTARVGVVPAAEFNASQAAIGELMALLEKQDAELAALKGRRCDRCRWWDHGECTMPHTGRHPVVIAYDGNGYTMLTDADFACNAWQADA